MEKVARQQRTGDSMCVPSPKPSVRGCAYLSNPFDPARASLTCADLNGSASGCTSSPFISCPS
eukprot:1076621-Rhodomonas_salina.2